MGRGPMVREESDSGHRPLTKGLKHKDSQPQSGSAGHAWGCRPASAWPCAQISRQRPTRAVGPAEPRRAEFASLVGGLPSVLFCASARAARIVRGRPRIHRPRHHPDSVDIASIGQCRTQILSAEQLFPSPDEQTCQSSNRVGDQRCTLLTKPSLSLSRARGAGEQVDAKLGVR